MKPRLINDTGSVIYPGSYVPILMDKEIQKEIKRSGDTGLTFPPVNVTELVDSYKVEVAIPGVKRENFTINSNGNILIIQMVNKEVKGSKGEIYQLHEFNYKCFERRISLPEDADTEFMSAEYNSGMLCLYVPKSGKPVKKVHTTIVVY